MNLQTVQAVQFPRTNAIANRRYSIPLVPPQSLDLSFGMKLRSQNRGLFNRGTAILAMLVFLFIGAANRIVKASSHEASVPTLTNGLGQNGNFDNSPIDDEPILAAMGELAEGQNYFTSSVQGGEIGAVYHQGYPQTFYIQKEGEPGVKTLTMSSDLSFQAVNPQPLGDYFEARMENLAYQDGFIGNYFVVPQELGEVPIAIRYDDNLKPTFMYQEGQNGDVEIAPLHLEGIN